MVLEGVGDWWKRLPRRRGALVLGCLLGIALTLCAALSSYAGMVMGLVREGGRPLVNATIEVRDSRNKSYLVATDGRGMYVVALPPGIYRVTIANGRGTGENILQSSAQPSRQDLDF